MNEWVKEFPAAITVTALDGEIIEMNDKAAAIFEEDGGYKLIGSNVLDCHPEDARNKLIKLMEGNLENIYTIEEDGKKKFIYQTPWFKDGLPAGLIEFSIEIPFNIPHHIRDETPSGG